MFLIAKSDLIQCTGVAKSVFHFDVQGSVAKSTHAGIPWLRYSRRQVGECVHFWPFDGWEISGRGSVVLEVYPALWSRRFPREERTADQHDAYSVAAWMQAADRRGRITEFLEPSLAPAERTIAQIEGGDSGNKVMEEVAATRFRPDVRTRVVV